MNAGPPTAATEPEAGVGSENGLTLVEVLVSAALIGMVLVPMVFAHTYFRRITAETRRVLTADQLARRCLAHLEVTVDFDALDGSTACTPSYGNFQPPRGDFHYRTRVDHVPGTEPSGGLKKVSIKVTFPTLLGEGHRTISCAKNTALDGSGCERWDRMRLVSPRR